MTDARGVIERRRRCSIYYETVLLLIVFGRAWLLQHNNGETLRMYLGIKLAVEMDIPNLKVESDSHYGITIVGVPSVEAHANSSLARSIKELETRLEKVKISHVYKESNFCADLMTKLRHIMEEGVTVFRHLPSLLMMHLLTDIRGIKFSRVVVV
ncbi:uncharacterized protein LOC130965568 [Arachis stenosperma]|uniref:uncharacterized protein LOC130965568 n=1 Tax=Arachis stenosperma TaxID=217475 RepID=UPI0025AD63D4|nr:uncharacterized protein LOC130965568 [Arachis stenosperma]